MYMQLRQKTVRRHKSANTNILAQLFVKQNSVFFDVRLKLVLINEHELAMCIVKSTPVLLPVKHVYVFK